MANTGTFQQHFAALNPPPPVTWALIGLNSIVFVLMVFNGAGLFTPDFRVVTQWGSNFGP